MSKKKGKDNKKFDYSKWYEENAEEINQKKRSIYRENKEYQAQQKERAKINYWKGRISGKEDLPKKIPFEKLNMVSEPHGIIDVEITNRKDVRYGNTIEVPVYTTRHIAKAVGRTPQTVRLWEERGIFPPVELRDFKGMRLFTEDQLKIFKSNRPLLDFSSQSIEGSVFARELAKDYAKLRDNIKPLEKD